MSIMVDSPPRSRPERRRRQRVRIGQTLLARFGATSVIVLDISDGGARIEHFAPFKVGRVSRFNMPWSSGTIEAEATVVSCRVHRFIPGKDGGTVYQSGLSFNSYIGESRAFLLQVLESLVARSLSEQVANMRGLGPVLEKEMPVFRSGVVVAADGNLDADANMARRLAASAAALERGYTRCVLIKGRRFEIKWTNSKEQPEEGFTVRASEPREGVERLCEDYLKANENDRRLIRRLAMMSVEDESPGE